MFNGIRARPPATMVAGGSQYDTNYPIDQGIRNTSRKISFEFLFINTHPPDKLHTGFRRGIE